MELTFAPLSYVEGHGATLLCPHCQGDYLHHERVEIFERLDDQDEGLHVSIADGKLVEDKDLSSNPSRRRHGLSIHFRCEHCPKKSILTIAQHKGNTWIDIK